MGSWLGKAFTKAKLKRIALDKIREARRRKAAPKTGAVFRKVPDPGPTFPRRKGWPGRKRAQARRRKAA